MVIIRMGGGGGGGRCPMGNESLVDTHCITEKGEGEVDL